MWMLDRKHLHKKSEWMKKALSVIILIAYCNFSPWLPCQLSMKWNFTEQLFLGMSLWCFMEKLRVTSFKCVCLWLQLEMVKCFSHFVRYYYLSKRKIHCLDIFKKKVIRIFFFVYYYNDQYSHGQGGMSAEWYLCNWTLT